MKPPTQTSLRLKTLGRALTLAGAFLAVTARAQSPIALKTPGYQPSGLAYNGKSLFVAENSGFRRIHTLDPLTGASRGSFLAPSPTGLDGQGNPNDLVSDGAGRLFVCDLGGRVYEIDEAGTKIFQSFAIPFRGGALAFDGRLLYISDQDSGLVRVTDRTGRFVRNFQSNLRPAGMVFDAASRNLWVISQFDGSVTEMSTSGVGLRSLAGPRKPGVQGLGAITKVGSSLYVAEVSDPDPFNAPEVPGTIFSVDVGLFRTPGYQPSGLAYDGKALFISENSGFRTIHKVHPTTGAVLKSFLAPSPTGFDGRGNPNDLAADGAGRLFVSDLAGVVYEIDDAGTKIFQSFTLPFQGGALAFDGTYLYAADSNSGLVQVLDRTGRWVRNFQSGLRPAGMVYDAASRNLWVISQFDGTVTEMSTSGVVLRSLESSRTAGPQGMGGIAKVGSKLYIAEVSDPDPFNAPEVRGTVFSKEIGALRTPGFQPSGLASDGKTLFVAENSGFRKIHRLHPTTGAVLKSFLAPSPTGFDGRGNPNDLAADGAGRLFVCDMAGVVYEINDTGTKIFRSFALPFRGGALAFDGTLLYISDLDSGLVQVTDREGRFVRSFQSGLRAAGMCFDPASGNLLVVSMSDSTISEITPEGVLVRSFRGPQRASVQGLGGIARFNGKLYVSEVSDPDPFSAPEVAGTVYILP